MSVIESIITAILAVIVSLLTGYYTNRKAQADIASTYQDMLAKEVAARKAEREEADAERDKMRTEFEQKMQELKEYFEAELADVYGWAERLVEQIKELGGDPVPFVQRRKRKHGDQ